MDTSDFTTNQPPSFAARELWRLKNEALKTAIFQAAIDGNVPLDEIPFT